MKKMLGMLLALVMLAGLGVGAGAVDLEPPDTSTWPVLVLDQPMTLDFFGYTDGFLYVSDTDASPVYMSHYRFIPPESGSYFFEILGSESLNRGVFVSTNDFVTFWVVHNGFTIDGKAACMEGGVEYFVTACVILEPSSTGTFQVVARKYVAPWYQSLPSFLQFLLRWLAFGWIWMR